MHHPQQNACSRLSRDNKRNCAVALLYRTRAFPSPLCTLYTAQAGRLGHAKLSVLRRPPCYFHADCSCFAAYIASVRIQTQLCTGISSSVVCFKSQTNPLLSVRRTYTRTKKNHHLVSLPPPLIPVPTRPVLYTWHTTRTPLPPYGLT